MDVRSVHRYRRALQMLIVSKKMNMQSIAFLYHKTNYEQNNMATYYAASKGEGERELITLMVNNGSKYVTYPRHNAKGILEFLKEKEVKKLYSFGYTFKRIIALTGSKMGNIELVNIKDMYFEKTKMGEGKISRMGMATALGINCEDHEPMCPKAKGNETASLYHAIVEKLLELKD
jgi:hypothetical protein